MQSAVNDTGLEGPDRRQLADIAAADLIERAVAPGVVGSVIGEPIAGLGGGVLDTPRSDLGGGRRKRREETDRGQVAKRPAAASYGGKQGMDVVRRIEFSIVSQFCGPRRWVGPMMGS